GSVAPDGIVLGIELCEALGVVVAVHDGAQDRKRRRADGAVVQIDFVFGNEKLLSDGGPVGFFVALIKSGFGQRRQRLARQPVMDFRDGPCGGSGYTTERG